MAAPTDGNVCALLAQQITAAQNNSPELSVACTAAQASCTETMANPTLITKCAGSQPSFKALIGWDNILGQVDALAQATMPQSLHSVSRAAIQSAAAAFDPDALVDKAKAALKHTASTLVRRKVTELQNEGLLLINSTVSPFLPTPSVVPQAVAPPHGGLAATGPAWLHLKQPLQPWILAPSPVEIEVDGESMCVCANHSRGVLHVLHRDPDERRVSSHFSPRFGVLKAYPNSVNNSVCPPDVGLCSQVLTPHETLVA